jgi:hypothetical protein
MHSRWYTTAVVCLWLASMIWLVKTKIVPPMLTGEAPSYRVIAEARADEPPVGWKLSVGSRSIGWALSSVTRQPNETVEVHSLVHFERVPLDQFIPSGLRGLLGGGEAAIAKLELETESLVLFDPLGRLAGFDAVLRIKPLQGVIKMGGTVKDNQLEIMLQSGTEFVKKTVPMPASALMGDDYSPQTRLPGLKPGKTWSVPSYSFLRPSDPIERLQATVEESTPVAWDRHTVQAWVVVYRGDPSTGLRGERNIRGRAWVHRDGTVLKQEIRIGGVSVGFDRMTDEETVRLQEKLKREGKQPRLRSG